MFESTFSGLQRRPTARPMLYAVER